jgi:hypothetical protein
MAAASTTEHEEPTVTPEKTTERTRGEAGAMPMCPMAATCKGMMQKPLSGSLLMIPGLVFIVVGVLIIIEPEILVWLMGAASILVGVVMLMLANFIRRVGAQLRGVHS